MVDDAFEERQKDRRQFELQWRLNMAFIEGNQYVDINLNAGTLEDTPQEYWYQERESYNHVGPIMRSRLAKLSRMRSILRCRPGTKEKEDLDSAKVGTHILKNMKHEQNMVEKDKRMKTWLENCGSALWKLTWNNKKGRPLGSVEKWDEVNEQYYQHTLHEGEVDPVVVPPYEIYPDSSYRENIRQCRNIIHAKAFHVDEIAEYWGVQISSEDSHALKLKKTITGTSSSGLGYGASGYSIATEKLEDHAIVKEWWEKPSRQHPDGRLIIVCGGKLLHYGPLPYKCGEHFKPDLPFVKMDAIERVGVFWGKSVVEDLIPIQRRYNALRNRKSEYLNRVALGQYTVEEGSMDIDRFEQEAGSPGAVHPYRRGYNRPRPMEYQPLPMAFHQEEQSLLQEFSMLSGVSEISRHSEAPPGVKSGVAMAIALEQDDTRLADTADNIDEGWKEMGKKLLRIYKQFVELPRTLRTIGENNLVEAINWTGADIQSDDVIVESIPAALDSPGQRRQMVFELLGSGLLHDPETGQLNRETRQKLLEMIELGNWESANRSDELQIQRAERENQALEQGGQANVQSYDDHLLHMQRHTKHRLTAQYEAKVQQDPALEQRFQQHVDQHLQALAPPDQSGQMAQQQAVDAMHQPGQAEAGAEAGREMAQQAQPVREQSRAAAEMPRDAEQRAAEVQQPVRPQTDVRGTPPPSTQ